MHPEALKACTKEFVELGEESLTVRESVENHHRNNGKVRFDRELLEKFDGAVVEMMKRSGCGKTQSFKVVRMTMIGYIIDVVRQPESAVEKLTAIVANFDSHQEVLSVYQPLLGVKMRGVDSLMFGDVNMFYCTEEKFSAMTKEALDAFDPEDDPLRMARFEEYIAERKEELLFQVVLHYKACAEPNKATELAFEEFSKALDIVRYTGYSIEHSKLNIKLGAAKKQDGYFVVGSSTVSQLFIPNRSFVIDSEALTLMGELQWEKICSLQRKAKPTYIEETVLRAIKWFSSAVAQDHDHVAFLHFVLALETLFSPEKGQPIGVTISDAVAFLLADTADIRIYMKHKVKDLYDSRSKIAHGATHEIHSDDLSYLAGLVQVCIRVVLDKSDTMKTKDELVLFIERCKYFGPKDAGLGASALQVGTCK